MIMIESIIKRSYLKKKKKQKKKTKYKNKPVLKLVELCIKEGGFELKKNFKCLKM